MKYLTGAQYLRTDMGISGAASLPTETLEEQIALAEDDIDEYMAFDLQTGAGFQPHVASVQAPWNDKTRRMRVPNFPIPIRQALRYRIQVSNASSLGDGFFATIQPGDVTYQTFAGYTEVVALTSVVYSMAPVLIAFGKRPPVIQLDYEAGFTIGVTGEKLRDSGDHTTYYFRNGFLATTYTVALSIQPLNLPQTPPIVSVNGTSVSSSAYTLDTDEGTVTFATPNGSTDKVTANYCYTIPRQVRDATVYQTTWRLAQRKVAQMGALPFDSIRSGNQQLKRKAANEAGSGALCEDALHALERYVDIAVG